MLAKFFGEQRDIALLLLRVVFGVVFIAAGYAHVSDQQRYFTVISGVGIPFPELMTPFVAWVELLGGVASLLGIFTRLSGLLLAIVMAVALITSRIPAALTLRENSPPPSFPSFMGTTRTELLLMAVALGLMLLGAGKYALDNIFAKKQ